VGKGKQKRKSLKSGEEVTVRKEPFVSKEKGMSRAWLTPKRKREKKKVPRSTVEKCRTIANAEKKREDLLIRKGRKRGEAPVVSGKDSSSVPEGKEGGQYKFLHGNDPPERSRRGRVRKGRKGVRPDSRRIRRSPILVGRPRKVDGRGRAAGALTRSLNIKGVRESVSSTPARKKDPKRRGASKAHLTRETFLCLAAGARRIVAILEEVLT